MKILGKLADKTEGNVLRINPSEISKDFGNILQEQIVATKGKIELRLHKCFKFRNEEPEFIHEGSLLVKEFGNATDSTKLTFEYQSKNKKEL